MKKVLSVFSAILALAFSAQSFGATLSPVQLLNPVGSTSGQAIISTGPTTAPGWGNPTATLGAQAANTVVANATSSSHTPTAVSVPSCSTTNSALQYTSGTGFGCTTNSAILGANTFTAAQTIGFSGVVSLSLNDSGGTNQTRLNFQTSGNNEWGFINASSTNQFSINRYNAGTLVDTPFFISNSTGAVTMTDGITNSPISGSTGSFTTLSASSGLNSTAVGNTTASTGAFTTLSASGLITPSATSGIAGITNGTAAPTGSLGENATTTVSSASLSNSTATTITSTSLAAGNWMVGGECTFTPAGTTTVSGIAAGASTTTNTLPANPLFTQIQASFVTGGNQTIAIPTQFFNVTTATTVNLVAFATFSVSTMTVTCSIWKMRFH